MFDVHKRQAMFHCHVEQEAGTQLVTNAAAVGVSPPPAVPNTNPFIQREAIIFIYVVAEVAVTHQDKRHRSDPQGTHLTLPLPQGSVRQPMLSDSCIFGCPGP